MNDHRSIAAGLATVLCVAIASAQDSPKWELEAQRLAGPLVDAGLIPGAAIGIFDNGETAFIGVGSTDPRGGEPPTSRTLYEIGSISKAFTGLLLAEAVRRDEVTLDTTVASLAPDGTSVPNWSAPHRPHRAYTLLDLATHTSGLPRLPPGFNPMDPADPYAGYDEETLWIAVSNSVPTTEPGSAYVYSNFAVGLLGTVLAGSADTSYESLLRARLAGPLGMKDTTLTLSPEQAERLAPGFTRSGSAANNWAFDALAGCGAVRSTVADLLILVDSIIEPPSEAFGQASHLALEQHRAAPGGPAMGLGWHIAGDGVTRWHNGQTGGYASMLLVNRETRRAVILLCNAAAPEAQAVAERLFQSMHGIPVDPPDVRVPVELPAGALEQLTGNFDGPMGLAFTFAIEEGRLTAQLSGQPALTVFPESATRFFYRDVPADLVFEIKEGAAQASRVTLFQNGRELTFTRRTD